MDEPGWLTITEIARRLGRPPSTVTYWRNTFHAELEERTDAEDHPTYDVGVFQRLDVLMRQRTPRAEIRRELAGAEPTPGGGSEAAILEELRAIREVLEELRAIRAALERMADRNDHP